LYSIYSLIKLQNFRDIHLFYFYVNDDPFINPSLISELIFFEKSLVTFEIRQRGGGWNSETILCIVRNYDYILVFFLNLMRHISCHYPNLLKFLSMPTIFLFILWRYIGHELTVVSYITRITYLNSFENKVFRKVYTREMQ
jgi:hypothetical protein